jgi:hypothetical protein
VNVADHYVERSTANDAQGSLGVGNRLDRKTLCVQRPRADGTESLVVVDDERTGLGLTSSGFGGLVGIGG